MNDITNYDMSSSVNIFFKKNIWCKFQLHHCVKSVRIRSYSGLRTRTPNTDTFRAVHAIDKGQGTNFFLLQAALEKLETKLGER